VARVADGDGRCQIIMRGGVLLPGMAMPVLGPPPPDPHPNPVIQRMREAWCLKIIDWEGVFGHGRPMVPVRRVLADHWRDPNTPRSQPIRAARAEDDDDG